MVIDQANMDNPDDIQSKIEKVNEILQSQEPENISVDSHGGYTGYKPQYIKNTMNTVFTVDGWGYDEISSKIETVKSKNGESLVAVARVEVWIEGLKRRPKAWGQSRVTNGDVGDALKGANTDAMKKALSDLSIGSRAFEGKLSEEDANEYKEEQKQQALRKKVESQRIKAERQNVNRPTNAHQQHPVPAKEAPKEQPQRQTQSKAQQLKALTPQSERTIIPSQRDGIINLCKKKGVPVPENLNAMTYEEAGAFIQQLQKK